MLSCWRCWCCSRRRRPPWRRPRTAQPRSASRSNTCATATAAKATATATATRRCSRRGPARPQRLAALRTLPAAVKELAHEVRVMRRDIEAGAHAEARFGAARAGSTAPEGVVKRPMAAVADGVESYIVCFGRPHKTADTHGSVNAMLATKCSKPRPKTQLGEIVKYSYEHNKEYYVNLPIPLNVEIPDDFSLEDKPKCCWALYHVPTPAVPLILAKLPPEKSWKPESPPSAPTAAYGPPPIMELKTVGWFYTLEEVAQHLKAGADGAASPAATDKKKAAPAATDKVEHAAPPEPTKSEALRLASTRQAKKKKKKKKESINTALKKQLESSDEQKEKIKAETAKSDAGAAGREARIAAIMACRKDGGSTEECIKKGLAAEQAVLVQ